MQYNEYEFEIVGTTLYKYTGYDKEVIIPKGVTVIERCALKRNINLKSVIIPPSVITIEECAFIGCSYLESIKIPRSVKLIKRGAFRGCQSLEKVTIAPSVKNIEAAAFSGSWWLTSVTIGAKVKIERDAKVIDMELDDAWNEFITAYNNKGRTAGTYTRPNRDSSTWTKR